MPSNALVSAVACEPRDPKGLRTDAVRPFDRERFQPVFR